MSHLLTLKTELREHDISTSPLFYQMRAGFIKGSINPKSFSQDEYIRLMHRLGISDLKKCQRIIRSSIRIYAFYAAEKYRFALNNYSNKGKMANALEKLWTLGRAINALSDLELAALCIYLDPALKASKYSDTVRSADLLFFIQDIFERNQKYLNKNPRKGRPKNRTNRRFCKSFINLYKNQVERRLSTSKRDGGVMAWHAALFPICFPKTPLVLDLGGERGFQFELPVRKYGDSLNQALRKAVERSNSSPKSGTD